ncbi:hypothetical protein [Chryseobacterium artocarpi]|uniref:hypothetical protein n=1 Tax=Chryseobacterium artocarpi TaxID=1414727 RepID=UPI003F2BBBC9
MKYLLFILLFLSFGMNAQLKKAIPGKVKKIEKKAGFKKNKKASVKKYAMKAFRDEDIKRIINLSQQNDAPKKEIVKKNNSGGGAIIHEEISSMKYRMYLFIGMDAGKESSLYDEKLMIREI